VNEGDTAWLGAAGQSVKPERSDGALMANAADLLSEPPSIEKVDVPAAKFGK